MEFPVLTANPARVDTGCIIVPVFKSGDLPPASARLDDASERLIGQLLERGDFDPTTGNVQLLPFAPGLNTDRLLLVGCGEPDAFDEEAFRRALDAVLAALLKLPVEEAAIVMLDRQTGPRDSAWKARMIAECTLRASWRFDTFRSKKSEPIQLNRLSLIVSDAGAARDVEKGARVGAATGAGINLSRELGELPGNVCTPRYLAEQAQLLGSEAGFEVSVLDEQALEEMGAGALLAVGRGSAEPSRLIAIEYRGADESQPPHVLVGKGITFDSGGISIKGGADMDEMKFDMGGAAGVMGAMKAIGALRPKINVVGVIAAAENMPDGHAYKPGDIITTLKGLTVEVLNTDAEGRLALADALTFVERYQPASVVDIATLTGACMVALGDHASGLVANDQALADALLAAGITARDRAWQLPLWAEYDKQLESRYADMANIGGRKAGAITAGCFLSRFSGSYRWAHLDIAGTAWRGKQGSTGRPVGLLTQYLLDCEASAE
ncbi:leucyl aminopeptidase [Kushneria aurantia]|uniref:Probable cytosol aminopeptidase n=1 Tax=Kushneria aurantia TaxID=504092 RepID=A0ABV6G0U5_9GAMM|nr:leucyl aminopeptidase [Kushneria aurantia]